MQRRRKADLEGWEIEVIESQLSSLRHYEQMLDDIEDGKRIVLFEVGDVTDEEKLKAEYYVSHYRAALAKREYNLANDNDPEMSEEVADLIAGDW